jgi:hypothetical protein
VVGPKYLRENGFQDMNHFFLKLVENFTEGDVENTLGMYNLLSKKEKADFWDFVQNEVDELIKANIEDFLEFAV